MLDAIMKMILGDLENKKVYKQMMHRVNALPKDYQYAFRKIQHYMYCVGPTSCDIEAFSDLTIFAELLNLFEVSVGEGRQLLEVIGNDVSKFSDDFMRAFVINTVPLREKLNKEIMAKFHKEEQ